MGSGTGFNRPKRLPSRHETGKSIWKESSHYLVLVWPLLIFAIGMLVLELVSITP